MQDDFLDEMLGGEKWKGIFDHRSPLSMIADFEEDCNDKKETSLLFCIPRKSKEVTMEKQNQSKNARVTEEEIFIHKL